MLLNRAAVHGESILGGFEHPSTECVTHIDPSYVRARLSKLFCVHKLINARIDAVL